MKSVDPVCRRGGSCAGVDGSCCGAVAAAHAARHTEKLRKASRNLTAPTPRTADGKPDLSGVWVNGGQGAAGRRAGGPPPPPADPTAPPTPTFFNAGQNVPGGLPFQEWAAELAQGAHRDQCQGQPGRALPADGIPAVPPAPAAAQDHPDTERDGDHLRGELRTAADFHGRPRAAVRGCQSDVGGLSIGRWDGDTLVVQSSGFRDGGWLDVNGSPFTDKLKLTERFTRLNYGTLRIDITVDDPKAYTKPWTVRITQRLTPEDEMIEFVCNENEQSSRHYGIRAQSPRRGIDSGVGGVRSTVPESSPPRACDQTTRRHVAAASSPRFRGVMRGLPRSRARRSIPASTRRPTSRPARGCTAASASRVTGRTAIRSRESICAAASSAGRPPMKT